jgi:hypothetical protein
MQFAMMMQEPKGEELEEELETSDTPNAPKERKLKKS